MLVLNRTKRVKRMEYKKIEEALKDIQNDIGYHFDFVKGWHDDWIVVEYEHDAGEMGLPASLFEILIKSMKKINYEFIKLFACEQSERTLDIVFKEIEQEER